jgi:ferrous iron transport protein B
VLLHRIWGIPIFLGIMYGLFQFVFNAAAPLTDLIKAGLSQLAETAAGASPAWWGSLLSEGIIGGVGSVLSFVPNIFFLFIAISILEDCGYLARAAFVMDRAMHRIGLHGRSFIPLVLGFGCTIPALMACRTIENPRDRITTVLISPFIACGARLPIFILLAGAFFPARAGLVVFALYVIGIGVAIITALIFRKTLFRGESGNMPWGVEYASAQSWLGRVGSFLAPVFIPCGFGQWPAVASLISGFFAKETVVGTLGAIFAVKEGVLGGALITQLGWTPLVAFGFMVFSLLYTPCIAAIGTMRSETHSWKWPWFSIAYSTGVAWVAATLIYQIGRLVTGT